MKINMVLFLLQEVQPVVEKCFSYLSLMMILFFLEFLVKKSTEKSLLLLPIYDRS